MQTKTKNYHWISYTIRDLEEKQKRYNHVTEASKENKDASLIDEIIESYNSVNDTCKHLYGQFVELRNDYVAGNIDLNEYGKYLRKLKTFSKQIKISNQHLHGDEMIAEWNKYFAEKFKTESQ